MGISIKPKTPVESVYPDLSLCDMVLVMTVEPGFGGQALIPYCIDKVRTLREEMNRRNLNLDIQVDGGVNSTNAPELIKAGANVLVAGSSVFKAEDTRAAIESLRLG